MHHESDTLRGYVIFIASIAAIGGFLFGFDSGVINGTVSALQEAFQSDSVGTGFSVASMLLGCAAGAFFAGGFADRFGRKPSMIVASVGFFISAWGSGAATDTTLFVAARVLGGVAVGAASVLAPAYISEVSPARFRGRLSSLQQLAIVIGLFVAFLSNYIIAKLSGGAKEPWLLGYSAWSWMFWVECIPALLFGIGAAIAPESPRFLVAQQRDDEARKVLASIHDGDIDGKIADIRESLRSTHKPRFSDVLAPGTVNLRLIVWLGIGLSVFQQLVGINVIFYYGEVLWKSAGFTEGDALLINVIGGAVNVGSTFVAIALVDKLGRKPLLLIGSVGMALMLGLVAAIFASSGLDDNGNLALTKTTGTLALLGANAYIFFFAISWGPVVWVMLGEMFNNLYRGTALGIAGGAQWIANFAITMTFPIMLTGIGLAGAYGFYAASAVVSIFFVWFFIEETKGKSLEAM
ncbi:sugar porter family MFS transporter [bacterium]|nr:sugar porter family MFS transporter [bacterium]